MAQKFLTSRDFTHNELLNIRFQLLASDPSSPAEGWAYWNSVAHELRVYDGSTWVGLGPSGAGGITDVAVASANGFAGTSDSDPSVPTLTLRCTVTGLVKGNGTALSAAVAGTDYAVATNGSNGQALISNGAGGFGTAVNASITIAGSSTALGGSITLDTITGLSSTGLVKRTGANTLAVATSGTDYAPATSGTSLLKGNGSGGFSNAVAGTDYAVATNGSNGNILVSNGSGGFGTALVADTDGTLAANSDARIATQKAVKTYVDSLAQGLDFKASVRVASTANGTLASAFENGDTIDGVVLATGDRILIKSQSSAAENGIYTVNASGAPTRATDADASGEISKGAVVFVEAGTTNIGQLWICTATGATPWVPGTSTSTWTQFGATVTDPTVPHKSSGLIGNGSSTSIAYTHSLGTKDVTYSIRDASTDEYVDCDVVSTSTTQITFTFATAPASNAYRVVVIG